MAVLKDTSLCAIVRDEIMNPAGGIERFVRSTVPYVERAIIFDTGSVDGTREKLDELQKEFPGMEVYDRPFDNYVHSRNASLEKVETKWTLILDADELITSKGFDLLKGGMTKIPKAQGYSFRMVCVSPDREDYSHPDALHNPRLFLNNDYFRYLREDGFSEFLYDFRTFTPQRVDSKRYCVDLVCPHIYHFLPDSKGTEAKNGNWYGFNRMVTPDWSVSPKKFEGYKKWKKFNPKRDNFN